MPFPAAPPQIRNWSWSLWNKYCECPLKAKLDNIDKIKEPPNEAMDGGIGRHTMAEAFVGGIIPKVDKRNGTRLDAYKADITKASKGTMPVGLARFKKEFMALRKLGASTEAEWAFNVDWKPTGWFAPDAWLRMKIDAHYAEPKKPTLLPIIDYKTGRIYADKGELQMELYGLAALIMMPAITVALPALWYLDQPLELGANPAQHEYTRDMLPKLLKLWKKRIAPMLNDRQFAPRTGHYCRWCFYRKSNTANNGTGRVLCKHG